MLEFDRDGMAATGLICTPGSRSAGEAAQPPIHTWAGPSAAAERLSGALAALRASDGGKSGKGQDFTISGCKLMLRKARNPSAAPIVRPEMAGTWASP
jgi:hypothetical protein